MSLYYYLIRKCWMFSSVNIISSLVARLVNISPPSPGVFLIHCRGKNRTEASTGTVEPWRITGLALYKLYPLPEMIISGKLSDRPDTIIWGTRMGLQVNLLLLRQISHLLLKLWTWGILRKTWADCLWPYRAYQSKGPRRPSRWGNWGWAERSPARLAKRWQTGLRSGHQSARWVAARQRSSGRTQRCWPESGRSAVRLRSMHPLCQNKSSWHIRRWKSKRGIKKSVEIIVLKSIR